MRVRLNEWLRSQTAIALWLHQFATVAKRVIHISALVTRQRLICDRAATSPLASGYEYCEVLYFKSRVSFPCRPEIGLDAEVNFQISGFEPCAAPFSEVPWLGCFRDSQHAAVKGSRLVFLSGRHRQLHMIETLDIHAMGALINNASRASN